VTSERPRALFGAAHSWVSPFQLGGQHLARELVSRGWDVAFVSNAVSPFHLLTPRAPFLRQRADVWRRGGIRDLEGHLWAYVPAALVTPFSAPVLRSAWIDRNWHRFSVPPARWLAGRRGFRSVDLLYLDTPNQRFWLDQVPHTRSVFRVADWMSGFDAFTPAMEAGLSEAARRVDLVAYSAAALGDSIAAYGPRRSLHLPNGVDFARISRAPTSLPTDLRGIPRPIALYVGAMDEWFDFGLVEAAARALPDVSFVLIGPDRTARARLPALSNLHVLGVRPWDDLPDYLAAASVGLIPFDRTGHPELVDRIHPLKLYEFAAQGLPIVATRWLELERIGGPAHLVSGADEFIQAIRQALAGPPDREVLRAFARSASWSSRVDSLLAELDL
jgi:glycosyltransferase involved in cell wall biosynthesis